MITANETIRDAYLLRSVLLEQLKNGYSSKIKAEYQKIIEDIIKTLNGYSVVDYTVINKIIDELRAKIDPTITLTQDLEKLAISESLFVQATINGAITVKILDKLPSDKLLMRVASADIFEGNTLMNTFKMFNEKLKHDLRGEINQSVIQGESIPQIKQRISERFNIAYRNTETIARTATQTLVSRVRQDIYEENEDIFKGYMWNSTLDSRVRITHAVRDGKTWDLKHKPIKHSYKFYMPYEYNCRCVITPITKSFKELGLDIGEVEGLTRVSIDGKVPRTTTFKEWLESRPPEFVNKFLGEERAKLYLKGKLTLTDFVTKNGRLLTLEELDI